MKIRKDYCHLCGSKYTEGASQPWECPGCGGRSYVNSIPTVEMAFFNDEGHILLAKRALDPNKGKYDLIGGFIDLGQTAEESLVREIVEELGLYPESYSHPQFVCSWISTATGYEFGGDIEYPLNFVFAAKLKTDNFTAQDDVAEATFFDLKDLENVDFSYAQYPEVIEKAHKLLFSTPA